MRSMLNADRPDRSIPLCLCLVVYAFVLDWIRPNFPPNVQARVTTAHLPVKAWQMATQTSRGQSLREVSRTKRPPIIVTADKHDAEQ